GHMMQPELATEAQANLSRLAVTSASSEPVPFFAGAWRANDVRLAEEDGRYSWATREGPGAWVQLDWPMEIEATQAVLYPLTARGCHVTAGTLTLSDGTSYSFGPLHEDGSPLVIPFDPPSTISWIRFTVDEADSRLVGLAELVVNGPPDVELPDTPPPPPTNLTTTEGVLFLRWNRVSDPVLAGYKLYYGTAPGEYTESVDVGDVSWFLMRDLLEDGVTYYIAAKGYNVYGTESETFSNEVSAIVHAPVVTSIEPDHGLIGGGTPITITGQYFAPRGVRVSLGGERAFNVRVVDEHTITAMTHWHRADPVDVVVSNPDDLSGVLPDGFTYEKPEPPTAETFSP
ncbi:MAG: IPT/TIG domain-containing protein, partial [Planctomycetes bacterium]|nr:IPT/TIG domain-containing protein [Planctomycetota bacterium]